MQNVGFSVCRANSKNNYLLLKTVFVPPPGLAPASADAAAPANHAGPAASASSPAPPNAETGAAATPMDTSVAAEDSGRGLKTHLDGATRKALSTVKSKLAQTLSNIAKSIARLDKLRADMLSFRQ